MQGAPFGRYRLVELLGRGGMGEVWKAFDSETRRVVAVKVLPAELASDPVFEQRFRHEAFTAASLNEPHVVPIHSFGEIDGRLYVDMRLIEGQDLHHVLKRGPLGHQRSVKVIEQVASALNAAHRAGLVHRDVKPSNILLGEDDFAYLIDFGIAKGNDEVGMTATGNVIGTWAYMAPERFSEGRSDSRSDIYALACVLYECLTASQPFPGLSVEQQVAGHLTAPPPRPSASTPGIATELDGVIAKGMAKDPNQRYATTVELARVARRAIEEDATKYGSYPASGPTMMGPAAAGPTQAYVDPPTTRDVGAWAGTAYGYAPPTAQGPRTGAHPSTGPIPPYTGERQLGGPATKYQTGGRQYPPPASVEPPAARARSEKDPWWQRKSVVLPVATLVIIAAVTTIATVFLSSSSETGADRTTGGGGPLSGTYSVTYGQPMRTNGQPYADAEGGTESWVIESVCTGGTCVATATRQDGSEANATSIVLDQDDSRWVGVTATRGTCEDAPTEFWESLSLQELGNGSLTGDFIVRSTGSCARNQQVTFTRTGDSAAGVTIADPAAQAARVLSPARGLHGRYSTTDTYPNFPQKVNTNSWDVQTFCLRTGQRCLSWWQNPDDARSFVFENGKWVLANTSFDVTCTADGSAARMELNLEYPLPEPADDPITALPGTGYATVAGGCALGSDVQSEVERTGD
ncbi:MAG: protein kinase domain-containing protein [Mycobacterium sp.]